MPEEYESLTTEQVKLTTEQVKPTTEQVGLRAREKRIKDEDNRLIHMLELICDKTIERVVNNL